MAGFRAPNPFSESGLSTGGNSVVSNATAMAQGATGAKAWHPTIVYLLLLLVVEWAGLIVLQKYI